MRRFGVGLIGLVAVACGGAQPAPAPAPVTPATLVTVPPPAPPPPPALPAEPARLSVIAPPSSLCSIDSAIGEDSIELGGRADGAPFLIAAAGKAKVTVGPSGVMFAEISTPTITLRGYVRSKAVRASSWVSFGGVYFPGSDQAVNVADARDGALTVAPKFVSGFTFADDSRSATLSCANASLETDATGTLARDLPAPFQGKAKKMFFKAKTPIPVSAEPSGPVAGTFDASDKMQSVNVLETRGTRARIRKDHIAGWVDAKLLAAKNTDKPLSALAQAQEFGMIGLMNGSAIPFADDREASPYVCTSDVRVIADLAPTSASGERFVVGTIPAGKPLRLGTKTDELTYLVLDPASNLGVPGNVRLAVPARDLVACSAAEASPEAPKTAKKASPAPFKQSKADAIDALDPAEFGMIGLRGDSFGEGGLGLGGVSGAGEGIGLGNIGTIGHTGTGSGFGSGSGVGSGRTKAPSLRQGATQVNGRLPPEVIQRIVRQNFGRFRLCYENGLRTKPTLQGRVSVRFVIDEKGAVKTAGDGGSDLPDPGVVGCVIRGFGNLSFPQPEGGIVTVVYPIIFAPGD